MPKFKADEEIGNKYILIKELGSGSFGEVWLARHKSLSNKLVAIKFGLHLDNEAEKRFKNEIQILNQLRDNPYIIKVEDEGNYGIVPYLVLECATAGNLNEYVVKNPPTLTAIAGWLQQLANVLDYAHSKGIIHRDLKPANILFMQDGTLRLCDFGIAHNNNHNLTVGSYSMGTPEYMAPEQITNFGKVGPQADIWALGVITLKLITGKPLFDATNVGDLYQAVKSAKVPNPIKDRNGIAVPATLQQVIARALEKDPQKRFKTPTDFAKAFNLALAGNNSNSPAIAATVVVPPSQAQFVQTEFINPNRSTPPISNTRPANPINVTPSSSNVDYSRYVVPPPNFKPGRSNRPSGGLTNIRPRFTLPWIIGGIIVLFVVIPILNSFFRDKTVYTTVPSPSTSSQLPIGNSFTVTAIAAATAANGSSLNATAGVATLKTGDVLFQDDFLNSSKPDWKPDTTIGNGSWSVDNGAYTLFSGDKGSAYVGSPDWVDYTIEMKITNLPTSVNYQDNGNLWVLVRTQDPQNTLKLYLTANNVQWLSERNGQTLGLNRQAQGWQSNNSSINLKIVVQGNSIAAYNGPNLITSVIVDAANKDKIPAAGYVGLSIRSTKTGGVPRFSNVKITKLLPPVQPAVSDPPLSYSATGVLFQDNFKNGANSAWKPDTTVGNGGWSVDGAGYSLFYGKQGFTYIGSSDWTDYSLETQVTNLPSTVNYQDNGNIWVSVRTQDPQNKLSLYLTANYVQWFSVKNGQPTALNRDLIGWHSSNNTINLRIVVQGNTVTAYDSDNPLASFTADQLNKDKIPTAGYIGLQTRLTDKNDIAPHFSLVKVTKMAAMAQASANNHTDTLPANILFQDDFINGPKADWKPDVSVGGSWSVDNGNYTLFSGQKGATYVGSLDWKDYMVEAKITNLPETVNYQDNGNISVAVRTQNSQNTLKLYLTANYVQWVSIKNGQSIPLNRETVKWNGANNLINLKIIVQGSSVTAFDGDTMIASFTADQSNQDKIPPTGYIGIEIRTTDRNPAAARINLVKVTKL